MKPEVGHGATHVYARVQGWGGEAESRTRSDGGASRAGFGVHGTVLRQWVQECVADSPQAFPGQGQMKPEQTALARLRREVIKLKAERDILKKAMVGSSDQRNTKNNRNVSSLIRS